MSDSPSHFDVATLGGPAGLTLGLQLPEQLVPRRFRPPAHRTAVASA